MKLLHYTLLALLAIGAGTACNTATAPTEAIETTTLTPRTSTERWSSEEAWAWYEKQPWIVGTNFTPSTAINQLEFWQAESFDLPTIERELGWSVELGMNAHRVFLHNLLWEQDSTAFLGRIEQYLEVADSLGIRTLFVLFDDCWNGYPKLGTQPDPVPLTHNSGWVKAPGVERLSDTTTLDSLEGYVKGIITHFATDPRILGWDLYNEPGQAGTALRDATLTLLKKTYGWAREVNPAQPLTTGLFRRGTGRSWSKPETLDPIQAYILSAADVLSFHSYDGTMEEFEGKVEELLSWDRPVLCTEYIARTNNNSFWNAMTVLKKHGVGAINWGLVAGKTGTYYPWSKWTPAYVEGTTEPDLWFHDILRTDGSAFDPKEIIFIKEMTGVTPK